MVVRGCIAHQLQSTLPSHSPGLPNFATLLTVSADGSHAICLLACSIHIVLLSTHRYFVLFGDDRASLTGADIPSAQDNTNNADTVPGSTYKLHRQPHARLPLSAHPDYVSVLTACAAWLWVKPMLLHAHVCQLEEQMSAAEAGMAKSFSSTPRNAG